MAGRQPHWGEFAAPEPPLRPLAVPLVLPKMKPLPSNPPELVQIPPVIPDASGAAKEFGVGPADFLHSLQLQMFLKKTTSGQQTSLPVLRTPITAADVSGDDLSRDNVLQLIRQVVILTCVDCGYERASETALNLLTECCGKFIRKISQELSSHRLQQRLSSVGEEDYLYQLLEETGFSVPTLHHFAKSISERKHERLLHVNRRYGLVVESCKRPAPESQNGNVSDISGMIAGLGDEVIPLAEEKIWDQSLDEMSQMTDEEILQSLTTD